MATNPRENSRGERISRVTSGRLVYREETSPTIIEIPAEMVERLYKQESLHSFPGSVPSGRYDGLVRTPLLPKHMPPFGTHDEPPKTVEDFKAESNLGRHENLIN